MYPQMNPMNNQMNPMNNQMNQMNNQMNQMNQMNPMNQMNQMNSMNQMNQPPNYGYGYGMQQQNYFQQPQYRPNYQANSNMFGSNDLFNKTPQQSLVTEVPKYNFSISNETSNSNVNGKKDPFSSLVNFK